MKTLIILAFLPIIAIKAQQPMPGGVPGACIWEITENTDFYHARWKSNLKTTPDSVMFVTGKSNTINNNPALYIDAGSRDNKINIGELASFSLFTVNQGIDTVSEKVLISIENDTAPEMVLTDLRLAAIDEYRYVNFNRKKNHTPKIYSYCQNKSKDSVSVSHRLRLGRPPRNQSLPVNAYKGYIPEMIFFNRFLSFTERQKVESYLALKYGITLNQTFPVSYLNSRGEIIWNGHIHSRYNQNIAGVGRDNASGLCQKMSESIQSPGVMKIGKLGEIRNNSFIIWGDNGKPLRFVNEAELRFLQREWEIVAYHSQCDSVFTETNVMSLEEINPLRTDEIYWMMIDRSGTGKYPYKRTEYIPCQPLFSERGAIFFNQIAIDPDSSGSDIITLIAAPGFFTRSHVLPPSCKDIQSGIIQTDIAGGTPPFIITLRRVSNSGFQQTFKEFNRNHIFEGISQGAYIIQITDAHKNTYTEKLWVSNSHLWRNKISETYSLFEEENLVLDASKGMPVVNYSYLWTLPDGSLHNIEKISISKPGTYLLSITDDNNCNSTLEIKVKQFGKANFKYMELFPNPTRDWFSLRIDLERQANVSVTISDITGKIVKQTQLKNDCFYWYADKIQQQGIYFITVTSGNERETLKLTVQ